MRCPWCGAEMNHHADKVVYSDGAAPDPVLGGFIDEMYTCPTCGASASRRLASAAD